MNKVKVVALIKAKPEHCETVTHAVKKMLAPTHKEPGCIHYELYEDQEHPGSFVFIELWRSEQALIEHMAMPYHDEFLDILKDKIESLEVKRLIQHHPA